MHAFFFLNLPLLFLSNALYPLATMPVWMRLLACANPRPTPSTACATLFGNGSLPGALSVAERACSLWTVANWYGLRSFRHARKRLAIYSAIFDSLIRSQHH